MQVSRAVGLLPPKPVPVAPKPVPVTYPSARAQRRIGKFYDEFSRGLNPFGLIPTFGVVDASAPIEEVVSLFDRFGVVKVRGVYNTQESGKLNGLCKDLSGLEPSDFQEIFEGSKENFAGGAPVLNDPRFWRYAMNPYVSNVVKALLTENAFEFGSSVAAHYSARGLHRDYRMLCEKEDNPYNYNAPSERIVRVLHYCASEHMHGGQLGIIPFSHDMRKWNEETAKIGVDEEPAWFDRHREVLTQARLKKNFGPSDDVERHIVWIATDPGDVIISNSAMLHCGEHLTMPRYFFVSTYAKAGPDTVKLAAAGVKSKTAVEYYEHQEEHGFLGSKAVLAAVKK